MVLQHSGRRKHVEETCENTAWLKHLRRCLDQYIDTGPNQRIISCNRKYKILEQSFYSLTTTARTKNPHTNINLEVLYTKTLKTDMSADLQRHGSTQLLEKS